MEEKIDFNKIYDRKNTSAIKLDLLPSLFGKEDLIPLWIADMDYGVSTHVLESIKTRLDHPIFGYTLPSKKLYNSTLSWFKRRHKLELNHDLIYFTSGVISSLYGTLLALGSKGDEIIIPTPSYPPFFNISKRAGLAIHETNLIEENNEYTFNFEEIKKFAKTSKFFILCNPHNPTGRAWREDELLKLSKIAKENNLTILSDDIHCDFVFEKNYTPLSKIDSELNLITAYSAGKTFNIPGLNFAFLNFSNIELKKKVESFIDDTHLNHINPITMSIYEEIYSSGDEWVGSMLSYLKNNRDLAYEFFKQTKIKAYKPEATMLMWLDHRDLNLKTREFFTDKCNLALSAGESFGSSFSGFSRLNFATQRKTLEEALGLIKNFSL